jgi:hypothetical protein
VQELIDILLFIAGALFLALSFPPWDRPEWKGYNEIDGEALRNVFREKRK